MAPPQRGAGGYRDVKVSLGSSEIAEQRGGFGRPGIESPFRDRTKETNLELFGRMCAGEFTAGTRVLRAKIDMQHENMQMRDPVMYRIRDERHHRTGDTWKIYGRT